MPTRPHAVTETRSVHRASGAKTCWELTCGCDGDEGDVSGSPGFAESPDLLPLRRGAGSLGADQVPLTLVNVQSLNLPSFGPLCQLQRQVLVGREALLKSDHNFPPV